MTRLYRHGTPASTPRDFGKRVVLEASPDLGLSLGIEAFNGGLKARLTWEHEDGHDLEGETGLDDTAHGSWMLMRPLKAGVVIERDKGRQPPCASMFQ